MFFRAQTQLNDELQKELVLRLGQLSGRPKENGLYKHPFGRIFGELDPEVSGENCGKKTSKNTSPRIQSWTRLSNIQGVFQKSWTALKRIAKTLGCTGAPTLETPGKEQSGRQHWHSDITFEQNPSDFSSLKLTQLPKNGAGTDPLNIILENTDQNRVPAYTIRRDLMGFWLWTLRKPLRKCRFLIGESDRHALSANARWIG